MKIVFYSSSSTQREEGRAFYLPRKADCWDTLAEQYPKHEFIVILQEPAYFLLDKKTDGAIIKPKNVSYVFLDENATSECFVNLIVNLKPDIAIALTISSMPLDWNGLKDSAIADILKSNGIKTIANPMHTSMIFFDKWQTHQELSRRGFNVAKAVFVHHGLFFAERQQPNIRNNVYKDCTLLNIKKLKYPVILKPTTGSASFRTEIAQTYEIAKGMLCSKKNKADILVEEFLVGEHFGLEIHRNKDDYLVMPPFRLSVNKDGLVDPMKNIKIGPISDVRYHIESLQNDLTKLAKEFSFGSITQVDLIFKDSKWFIIELNPRWSGMTETMAVSRSRSSLSILIDSLQGCKSEYTSVQNLKYALSVKIPSVSDEILQAIFEKPYVRSISEFPLGKTVYRELILGGQDTKEALVRDLLQLFAEYPTVISETIVEEVKSILF